jgi:protein-S-isoprenylcysteine O-methyltransferase Ste14
MAWLELKLPPVLVFLLAAIAIYLCSNIGYQLSFYHQAKHFIFHSVFVIGVLVGISGAISFKLSKTTLNPIQIDKASQLVDSGVFRFSRNPMYLGLLVCLIALFLRQEAVVNLLWLVGFVVYMNQFQIKPEERALVGIFGEKYTQYQTRVRRWL